MDPQQQAAQAAEQHMMDYALLAVLAGEPLMADGQPYWPDLQPKDAEILCLLNWNAEPHPAFALAA